MTRRTAVGLALVSALAVSAQAGTKFKSVWKAPDAAPTSFKGKKVAAVVMLPDEKARAGVADELAYALRARGIDAVSAHRLVPPEEMKDKDRARARLEQAGVVGAVVMRAVDRTTQLTDTSGAYWVTNYWSFSGYYGWGWGGMYDPGHVKMDTLINVETLIFDVKADKLLWAALSETKNPKRVDTFMQDLVSAAAKEVQKQGLVKKP